MKPEYKYYGGELECPFNKSNKTDAMDYYRFWFWTEERRFFDQNETADFNAYITEYCQYLELRHGGEYDDCAIDMLKTYQANAIIKK